MWKVRSSGREGRPSAAAVADTPAGQVADGNGENVSDDSWRRCSHRRRGISVLGSAMGPTRVSAEASVRACAYPTARPRTLPTKMSVSSSSCDGAGFEGLHAEEQTVLATIEA
eukprot:260517-Pleurochrysis_carterae.AAC.1